MMNGQLVELRLPLEVIKSMIFQLPKEEQKVVAQALAKKTLTPKKPQSQALKGYLKGLVAQEKDFLEAEQSLFKVLNSSQIYPFDEVVLSTYFKTDRGLEIHDRVIVATAKITKSTVITKDRKIKDCKKIKVVW